MSRLILTDSDLATLDNALVAAIEACNVADVPAWMSEALMKAQEDYRALQIKLEDATEIHYNSEE